MDRLYIVMPHYVLVRNRVIGNLKNRLRQFEVKMVRIADGCASDLQYNDNISTFFPAFEKQGERVLSNFLIERNSPIIEDNKGGFIHIHLNSESIQKLRQILASYLGHFKHANAYKLIKSIFKKYRWLSEIYALKEIDRQKDKGDKKTKNGNLRGLTELRIVPLYEPSDTPQCLADQYYWAAKYYGTHCIFFQVGKFCNFYGQQAERFSQIFSLNLQPDIQKNMPSPMSGFPIRLLKGFKKRAVQSGLSYIVIGEQGYYASGLKKRVITEIFKPL